LAELAKYSTSSFASAAYMDTFHNLVAVNPAEALAALANLPAGSNQDAALRGLIMGWSSTDPKSALDWISNSPSVNSSLLKTALVNAATSGGQPALAAQYINLLQDPADQANAIITIASAWGSSVTKDPAAALTWLGQVSSGSTYNSAVLSMLKSMTATNVTYISTSGDTTYTYGGPISPNGNPNTPNFQAIAGFLGNITDPATLSSAINLLATNWSKTDPQSALAWAQTLQGTNGAAAINAIIPNLATTDPSTALSLVQSLPAGTTQDTALNGALAGAAKSDPTDALNYALSLPDDSSRDAAINGIVSTLSITNPSQAAALVLQIPAGATQIEAATTVASTWVKKTPPPFLDWLNGLPVGDVRDAAIVQLDTSGQAAKHPTMVFNQANSISNPDLRAVQVQQVLTNWAANDPQAAYTAAQTANLPDEQRAALVQKFTPKN
jgi:hypothetical protein